MGDVARERDVVMEDGLWFLLGLVVERLRIAVLAWGDGDICSKGTRFVC